jgi:hypothetical protein
MIEKEGLFLLQNLLGARLKRFEISEAKGMKYGQLGFVSETLE